jgi:hypothetical protein
LNRIGKHIHANGASITQSSSLHDVLFPSILKIL